MIDVPDAVRAKARVAGADPWLDELPALVASLEREWDVRMGAVYPDATEALVAEATSGDGRATVLKVLVPQASVDPRHEITVLRVVDGNGCARLLRHDEDRGALLVERLGASLADVGLPLARRLEVLCDVARRVWRPAPDAGLPDGAEKARALAAQVAAGWEELDRPCSERAVAHALGCAERRARAHDDERAMLVHGDVQQWNTLRAGEGFKLVDPDGLLAEPECDLGVLMREDPVELLHGDPRDRARRLAALTGLDAEAIWDWGVVERVSTGLLATRIGLQPVGGQMLATADAVAE